MQTYTFSQCIKLLAVDAKVFRRWIREDLSLGEDDQKSRSDSRVRYLTREQLEQLAQLHDKELPGDLQTEHKEPHVSHGAYKLLMDRAEKMEKAIEAMQETMSSFAGEITYAEVQVSHLRESIDHSEEDLNTRLDVFEHRLTELEAQMIRVSSSNTEQQIAAYQQRIAELEAQLAAFQQEHQQEEPKKPASPLKKKPARKKRSAIKALPASLVARNAFAAQHNISEKFVSKAALEGKIATITGKWMSGKSVITRALNERGKHDFYQVFHQRAGFKACDHCPHAGSEKPQ
jgi:chromosome segregation ATPase